MADVHGKLSQDVNANIITLTAGVATRVLALLAPANQAIRIWGYKFMCNGISGTDKALEIALLLYKVTSGAPGITGGAAVTPCPYKTAPEAFQGTYKDGSTAITALTGTGLVAIGCPAIGGQFHPQGGMGEYLPFQQAIRIGGNQLAVFWAKAITADVQLKYDAMIEE